ncbi:MAG: Calx-beta domain-containing protein, partial [Vicinamibacterales bacterium]
ADFGASGNPAQVSGTLNWAAGDAASKTITIPILDDAVVESAETFFVGLGSPVGASIGTPAATVVTVLDDEASLNFSSPTYSVGETGASASVTVNRSGAATNAVSVTWTTANGTAVAGQDFGISGNPAQRTGTLSWAAGDSAPKSFTVGSFLAILPVVNDALAEGDESFTITLSAPTGGAVLGPTSTASVTIVDDESTVGFSPATLTVSEAGPNGTLTLTRTGSNATAASVAWTTVAGTAAAGADFTQSSGTVSWAAGDGSPKTITVGPTSAAAPYIAVVNDATIEGPETFTVTLSSPTGGAILGTATATVTLDSDDRGITMTSPTQAVSESAGSVAVSVTRSGASTGAVSVNYATANGTALAGTHYTATSGTLNWADGDTAAKTITVPVIDDGAVNTARTFSVGLSGAVGATLGSPSATTVTIADDDNTLQFTSATATVAEGTPSLVLTVSRVGGTAGAASVNWSTADGTALAGADFGASGNPAQVSGTLNWAAGDAASKTITIPILDDAVVESAESFTVNLAGPAGATIGTLATATVTVNDNDAGVVFAAAGYVVAEAGGSVTITANRIGPATSSASVNWTTANGSAVAGEDFGITGSPMQRTGTLSWFAGDASPKSLIIPIVNDGTAEGNETFSVEFFGPSAGLVLGTPSVTWVSIVDDETPPESTLQFSVNKTTVTETMGTATLTVTRTGSGYTFPATVNYTTVPVSALSGSDFTPTSGTLSWASGDSSPRTITVPLTGNAVAEPPEQFAVLLATPSPGVALGANSIAIVLVLDDDDVFPPLGGMPPGWTMPPAANAGWHVSNDPGALEGVLTLRTDTAFDNEVAQVEVSGTYLAGTLSFFVKVSSEPGFDALRFYVDGVKVGEWSGTANAGWQSFSLPVAAGAHTFRWSYEKDGSGAIGQDAAWLDSVTLPPQ